MRGNVGKGERRQTQGLSLQSGGPKASFDPPTDAHKEASRELASREPACRDEACLRLAPLSLSGNMPKPTETKIVACPYCASTDTEIYALFGQQLLTMQYYCKSCHTPFEYVKDDDALSDGASFSGKDTQS